MSEVTVGKVGCIQAQVGIHQHREGIEALLQRVLRFEAGSLADHKCRDSERASADRQKVDVRVNLQVESLLD